MEEIWRPVVGYEGYYEVSNLGRVRSLERKQTKIWRGVEVEYIIKKKILKQSDDGRGYLRVSLHKDKKSTTFGVHQIVAMAFVPNPHVDKWLYVNHKDENKSNNRANNLEWCDMKYNANYGTRNLRVSIKRGIPVAQIDKDTNKVIATFHSSVEAQRQLGVDHYAINLCCKQKLITAGGFKWWILDDIENFDPTFNGRLKRAVYQTELYDKTILGEFDSISEASEATGVDVAAIVECCKGNRKSTYRKYRWCYQEDYDKMSESYMYYNKPRKVRCLDINTKECLGVYDSAREASKVMKVDLQTVIRNCEKICKNPRKYIFEYINE